MPLPNLKELMQKAKDMQSQMQKAQKAIASILVVGEAGGGLIKIHMNGVHQTLRVEIAPELLKEDPDMLEDLIASACNDAAQKIEKTTQARVQEITKNIQLPEDILSKIEE
ncbi:MAG: YbaB/EbfC family nucleoid-associated protein [Gammaproteobacteria bacterium]|nr:YbaB/EbfC family nucleoid-associated protein [Gammaproteobacteria bacterium]